MSRTPIDEYLAELGRRLRWDPLGRNRALAEAADHLRELTREGEAKGLDRTEAERRAIQLFGSPRQVAEPILANSVTLQWLLRLGAVGLTGIAAWLVTVLFWVLPHRNDDQIPFWTFVMLGFLGYAIVTWGYVSRPSRAWLWVVMLLGSGGAVVLGILAIVSQEISYRRNGDWEGYIVLMALALILHGLTALAHLWRSRRARLPARA